MRPISVAFLTALLVSVNAAAFTGREHRCISETALAMATKDVALECPLLPAKANPCDRAYEGGETFGDLTRVVDWYQDPMRFAPFDWTIRQRQTRFLRRMWATHNNVRHFQDGAATAYRDAHKCALDAVSLCDGLWYEAMALHYLQDFFSPGHVVTPRTGSNDVVSSSLHDRFSRRGADLTVDTGMLRELEGMTPPSHIYGDGRLDQQATDFLIAISAASIREVVEKHQRGGTTTQLTLCFRTRSAEPIKGSDVSEVMGTARGPYAALLRSDAIDPRCKCESEAIAQYQFTGDGDLRQGYYNLWGFRGAELIGVRGGARRVTDVGMLIFAEDPTGRMRRRTSCDECSEETFQGKAAGGAMLHFTNVEGARYRAQGLHLEFDGRWKKLEFSGYAGYRRYRHESRSDKRPEIGGKVGYGLDVLNAIVAIERTHTVDSSGKLRQVYAVMPGVELFISPTWLETIWKFVSRQ